MQRFVLSDHPLVLVGVIDDLSEVTDEIAHVAVGDDHQLVKRREEPTVGGHLAAQVVRVFELVGVFSLSSSLTAAQALVKMPRMKRT